MLIMFEISEACRPLGQHLTQIHGFCGIPTGNILGPGFLRYWAPAAKLPHPVTFKQYKVFVFFGFLLLCVLDFFFLPLLPAPKEAVVGDVLLGHLL